ncbi:hypothetical protein CASFOL_034215 [Castilleja foliolosa]|uniref:Uncharacterized protein n=1 Tax=Castilleja foliolosa TaxID=1961234 RepID=A0ABD3BXJ5_9LAMI
MNWPIFRNSLPRPKIGPRPIQPSIRPAQPVCRPGLHHHHHRLIWSSGGGGFRRGAAPEVDFLAPVVVPFIRSSCRASFPEVNGGWWCFAAARLAFGGRGAAARRLAFGGRGATLPTIYGGSEAKLLAVFSGVGGGDVIGAGGRRRRRVLS